MRWAKTRMTGDLGMRWLSNALIHESLTVITHRLTAMLIRRVGRRHGVAGISAGPEDQAERGDARRQEANGLHPVWAS